MGNRISKFKKQNKKPTHLEEVNESYFTHLFHSWSFAFLSLTCFFIYFMHGIFPFLFTKTGGNLSNWIVRKINVRTKVTQSKKNNVIPYPNKSIQRDRPVPSNRNKAGLENIRIGYIMMAQSM